MITVRKCRCIGYEDGFALLRVWVEITSEAELPSVAPPEGSRFCQGSLAWDVVSGAVYLLTDGGEWKRQPADDKLIYTLWAARENGAFCGCTRLTSAEIPASVRYIGMYGFADTALKSVAVQADCDTAYTSFPPDCEVKREGDCGQLRDCENRAILDRSARRIYTGG